MQLAARWVEEEEEGGREGGREGRRGCEDCYSLLLFLFS